MSGLFSFFLGHALNWSGKLIYLSILLGIWEIFVAPYIDGIKVFAIWLLNRSAFVMFSYEVMAFVVQIVIVIATFKIVMWVLSPPEQHADHTKDKK